ncbi:MAG: hypothetical protein V1878_01670 [bacterium]
MTFEHRGRAPFPAVPALIAPAMYGSLPVPSWPSSLREARDFQRTLRDQVLIVDCLPPVHTLAAADVAYPRGEDWAWA